MAATTLNIGFEYQYFVDQNGQESKLLSYPYPFFCVPLQALAVASKFREFQLGILVATLETGSLHPHLHPPIRMKSRTLCYILLRNWKRIMSAIAVQCGSKDSASSRSLTEGKRTIENMTH